MPRPEDYGDQFPSDLDDVTPNDPTAGFEEVDYSLHRRDPRGQDTAYSRELRPSGADNIPDNKRTTYAGIILGWANPKTAYPRYYWVLRQDGAYGLARTLATLDMADFRPGDSCALIEDQTDNQWIIIGHHQNDESSTCDCYLSVHHQSNRTFIVPYDKVHVYTPVDNTFGGFPDILFLGFGVFMAFRPFGAMYEIDFNVTVISIDPDEEVPEIRFGAACWSPGNTNFETDPGNFKSGKIYFNRNTFRVHYDSSDCTANVDMYCEHEGAVLNQQDKDKHPVWTTCPEIGGDVKVGTKTNQGWVKIGNDNQYAWLSHGGGKVKIRLPSKGAGSACDFLVSTGVSGECVQLGWQSPGGSGTIKALDCTVPVSYNYCYTAYGYYCQIPEYTFTCNTWNVSKGLVISGPGISSTSCSNSVECLDDSYKCKKCDPCDTPS